MEKVEEILAKVEVELFGQKYEIEPTFELIVGFEERMGSSIVKEANWFPQPKLSAAAMLLWLGIGGPKSGKTVKDVAAAMKTLQVGQSVALALMIARQLVEPDQKKEDAP
jgi:hypothetical protein